MKFSLKSLLITMCLVGLVFGVMVKLLREDPQTFLAVLRLGSTVGPFLLAILTIIGIGLHGAEYGRKLIVWGVVLLLTPLVINGVLIALLPSGNPMQLLSTDRLISKRLAVEMDSPWVWRELERRLNAGNLTKAQVDEAVNELAAHMKRTKPAGWDEPLSWQRDFLATANQRNMISPAARLNLSEAFFGPAPQVRLSTPSLSEKDAQFNVEIVYGTAWADNSGLDVALLWEVNQVLVDGQQAKIRQQQRFFGREAHLIVEGPLAPGDHELTVELECAFVEAALVTGLDVDKLPSSQWPETLKTWRATERIPFPVAPAEE